MVNHCLVCGAITILKKIVNGKDDIPYMKWKIKHVWNHQPEKDVKRTSMNAMFWKMTIHNMIDDAVHSPEYQDLDAEALAVFAVVVAVAANGGGKFRV